MNTETVPSALAITLQTSNFTNTSRLPQPEIMNRYLATALLLLIVSAGCGDSGPERVVVAGQVTLNGDAIENGFVRFFPTKGTTGPMWGEGGAGRGVGHVGVEGWDGALVGWGIRRISCTCAYIHTCWYLDYGREKIGNSKNQNLI